MKRSTSSVFALAILMQAGAVSAAECPTNYSLRGPYWTVTPMIMGLTPGASMPINGSFKISMMIQTLKASDGAVGCVGSSITQKGMAAAQMNPMPMSSCTQPTITGATLIEGLGISNTATYTFIGRIPLGQQNGAQNTPTNYDYQIVIKGGKTDSVCFSAVSSTGTSEFWDGR